MATESCAIGSLIERIMLTPGAKCGDLQVMVHADLGTRWCFAADLLNLTLAALSLNRCEKRGHNVAGWLPPMNWCWFANRIVEVRRKYRLTVDQRMAEMLERPLSSCALMGSSLGARGPTCPRP